MLIILYIVVFIIIGYFIGAIYQFEEGKAWTSIIVISVLWAFVMGPFAIATFIELVIGYKIAIASR